MTIRIINNQKIDLTDDEFAMYNNIANSYTNKQFDGKTLFDGLFQTDDRGIIMSLIPPNKRVCSMEVYLYMSSIMIQQHIRLMYAQIDDVCAQVKKKFDI